MATQSSILAWRIPWTKEPGVLQSVRSHDWVANPDTAQQLKMKQSHQTSPSLVITSGVPSLCISGSQHVQSLNLLFFFLFIYFNWRLIILQYYGSFCHTLTWINHRCTRVPHPNSPPTSLPIPSLWDNQLGHQLWVPCFKHHTWTGNLFHIW